MKKQICSGNILRNKKALCIKGNENIDKRTDVLYYDYIAILCKCTYMEVGHER